MEITQQTRDAAEAAEVTPEEAAQQGMAEKSAEFKKAGGEIYS